MFFENVVWDAFFGINRNILECKSARICFSCRVQRVLIETYWNVNSYQCNLRDAFHLVLIETYWNVNQVRYTSLFSRPFCINRNILECK